MSSSAGSRPGREGVFRRFSRCFLDPETRYPAVTAVYLLFAAVLLFHHIPVTIWHKVMVNGGKDFRIPIAVFAVVSLLFGRLWKDKLFWILLVLWVLKIVSVKLNWPGDLWSAQETSVYTMSAYAFFCCYAVGRCVSPRQWKPALSVFCAFWATALTVFCGFGLYVAFTGNPVSNLGNQAFTVSSDQRLQLIYHPVTSGIILSTGIPVLFLGCTLAKRKLFKALYILVAVIVFVAGSLTGTRTAYLLSGIAIAVPLCLVVYDRFHPKEQKRPPVTAGRWILLTLLFAAVTGGIAMLQSYTLDAVNWVQEKGLFVSDASAEDESLQGITHRGFEFAVDQEVGYLSGRLVVWGNVMTVATSDAHSIFIGQSLHNPMERVNNIREGEDLYRVSHSHSTFLQTLLENGFPGFLLLSGFFAVFLFHAFRLLRNVDLPRWQRLLPLPVFVCLIGELVDVTSHVSYGYPSMTLLYLFAGLTVVLGRKVGKKQRGFHISEVA